MSGATGRQRVQEKCFDNFFFAHPDPKTLSAFADFMRPLFKNVFALSKKNANLRNTRDLLLPKLVSGQLNVENLDIDEGVTE
jgi:type I restriction enzyme S subunit